MRERREMSALLSLQPPTGPSSSEPPPAAAGVHVASAALPSLRLTSAREIKRGRRRTTGANGGSQAAGEELRQEPDRTDRLVIPELKTIPPDDATRCSTNSSGNATVADVLPEFLREYSSRGLPRLFRPSIDRGAVDKFLHVLRHEASRVGRNGTNASSIGAWSTS